ncbi:hypothetical protein Dsin_013901 [Dipteronia sinensis]|uniref:Uncharacterized protein n=1 Tax=Dipteronia sinensis TaxID=43782 RepID=A0AAE0AKX6_9ROSI|nr:hypothetical protein Dsin_013901 [Dipteronia sinensis]
MKTRSSKFRISSILEKGILKVIVMGTTLGFDFKDKEVRVDQGSGVLGVCSSFGPWISSSPETVLRHNFSMISFQLNSSSAPNKDTTDEESEEEIVVTSCQETNGKIEMTYLANAKAAEYERFSTKYKNETRKRKP